MKTRIWHSTLALLFAIVFISALSAGLSGRSAQALSAPPAIGLLSAAPAGPPASPHSQEPDSVCAASAIPTYTLMFTATKDAYVNAQSPSTNYGSATELHVGLTSGFINRAQVQFDLAALPSNAVVVSATMELYWIVNLANGPQATQAVTNQVQAILASWDEATINWTNQPASESRGDPSYILVSPGYNKLNVTQIAQAWRSGAVINNGIRISSDSDASFKAFESRHNTHKPRLTIVYHTCGKPVTGVSVSGPTSGITGTGYTFNSLLSPLDATTPITYKWSATNYACGPRPLPPCPVGATATYTWTVLGTQTVTLTAKNCSGETFTATQVITLTAPKPSCPFPLTSVALNGPTTGITGTNYAYTATTTKATYPITYTWQATDQTPRTQVVSATKHVTSFNWLLTGNKLITVTAQNCNGAATANRAVSIVDPAQLPDLVITSAWYESDQNRVGYLIKNVGGGTAYAGHTTELFKGGVSVALQVFAEDLIPGAIRAGYIDYAWSCGTANSTVRLKADSEGDVGEQNEANNEWQATWACDQTPPAFTTLPTVTAKTETTAQIQWSTSETTTGHVQYDTYSGIYSFRKTSAANAQNHQVTLTGLEAGKTYHYNVVVTDTAGQTVNSPDRTFATQSVGTDPPQIKSIDMLEYPSDDYDFYILRAVLTQTQGIDHVSFFLDGQYLGRDLAPEGNVYEVYLSPAALGYTRTNWFKSHPLQVQAYNLENEVTPMVKNVTPPARSIQTYVAMYSLKPGDTILVTGSPAPAGTTVTATVRAYQYEWKCTSEVHQPTPPGLEPVVCVPALQHSVSRMSLLLDGTQVGTTYIPPAGVLTKTFPVNLTGKSLGVHTLEARAVASDNTQATRQKEITIKQGAAYLDVTREVTRVGNYYQIKLTLKNIGNLAAQVDKVIDNLKGFQALRQALGATYTVQTAYAVVARETTVTLDLKNGAQTTYTLAPGAQHTIEYLAVPIMYQTDADHSIGYESSGHIYYTTGSSTTVVEQSFYEPELLWNQVAEALQTSNYLIMTNPQELFDHTAHIDWGSFTNPTDQVQAVLSSMAQLAYLKNGVLGYLDTTQSCVIDALLEPGGAWADALHPDFGVANQGYVLFVGENEIIPAQAGGYGVSYSDLRYASTSGQAKPELVLGRIIGDDAPTLNQALQAAIRTSEGQTTFDRSNAILYSGRGEGESTFWGDVKNYANQLDDEFVVTKLRGKDYVEDDFYAAYQPLVANQDVILYRGHGNETYWFGLGPGQVPGLGMTNSAPFVYSLACTAGGYDNVYGMAEAFLRYGAANYIGSVKVSEREYNSWAGTAFFNRWNAATMIGNAFTDMKRDKWAEDDSGWRQWIYEYQLYGDPKYGAVSTMAAAARPAAALPGLTTTLDVHVPDYELTTNEDGQQVIDLPGGLMLLEAGQYQMPYWSVSQTYPQGQQVQSVTLTARSGLVAATGLNIPTVTLALDCLACNIDQATVGTGWYPALDVQYRWTTEQNADGTTTLIIVVYPLYYNAQTTDLQFYQDYSFEIQTIPTAVELVSVQTDQPIYPLGDTVQIDLRANNPGAPQDVVVVASINTLSDELAAGLPLQSWQALTGTASASLQWNTSGFAAGDYYVAVELQDTAGNVLNRRVREFTLGVKTGAVTALNATPQLFKIGNSINVTLTFNNTGDVPLTGTAVIQIAHTAGLTYTTVFTHPIANLAPENALTVADVWTSAGMPEGDYAILGYVKDEGQTLGSESMTVSTLARVYLPLVVRQ